MSFAPLWAVVLSMLLVVFIVYYMVTIFKTLGYVMSVNNQDLSPQDVQNLYDIRIGAEDNPLPISFCLVLYNGTNEPNITDKIKLYNK